MLLMIDNYDSFTFNLVQYLGELGADVVVHRNDKISLQEIETMRPAHIVLSPGPCTPDRSGLTPDIISRFAERIPILGVCLGHQAIGQVFGAEITYAAQIMHGKTSVIRHTGVGVFFNLPDGFSATRYHSLIVANGSLPDVLEMTAWTEKPDGEPDEIMGFRHRELPLQGVQFHPESILTEHGHQLLQNFLEGC